MKNVLFILIALLACSLPTKACLNYYYTVDRYGHMHAQGEESDVMIGFNTNFNLRLLQKNMEEQQTALQNEPSYKTLSDYAVMLMKAGRNDAALTILQSLYTAHPNEYQLAANLGTSYELAGETDSALKYIKRGMELNPDAHEGSEWVHVKVLEAKLRLRTDSAYLSTHTVLDLTPQQEMDTMVAQQLEIQLRERFPFCPGPDPIMACLMEDFADVTMNTNSIEDAKAYYNIAKYYFGDTSEAMNTKIAVIQQLISKHRTVPVPEVSETMEGDNLRLGPYRYTEMLDDNNPDGFMIDWSALETDPALLLKTVGLEPVVFTSASGAVIVSSAVEKEGSVQVEEWDWSEENVIVCFALAFAALLIGVFAFRK